MVSASSESQTFGLNESGCTPVVGTVHSFAPAVAELNFRYVSLVLSVRSTYSRITSILAKSNTDSYLVTKKKYGGQYNDLAVKFSQRSNDLTKSKNWMYLDTLARATFESGKIAEAIELQNKAIELSGGAGLDDMNKSLARFEKATSDTKLVTNAG